MDEYIDYSKLCYAIFQPNCLANSIDELIRPSAVIASHANEAATSEGKVLPNTKTAAFIETAKTLVYVPLSGRTMTFDADGSCTGECTAE